MPGVPQGSILASSFFFLVYINDLLSITRNTFVIFE